MSSSNSYVSTSARGKSPGRQESMAYPPTNTLMSKISLLFRQHSQAVIVALCFLALILVVFSESLSDWRAKSSSTLRSKAWSLVQGGGIPNWGGALQSGYFSVADSQLPGGAGFRFAAVTDLDELSVVKDAGKPEFKSILVPGRISQNSDGAYSIHFEPTRTLITKHNEAGRGAEFSELTVYNNRLLTFDDRTGDVFEILNNQDGTDSFCVPRFVITEGSGETDKGMKWEWSTVKNGELYLGSMGKEYTRKDGSVVNRHNLWIATINGRGEVHRENWADKYNVVRKALNAGNPGYLIIEAVNWSEHLKKWVFLPRRISSDAYDEVKDERMGGNKLVLVDESFTTTQVVEINGMARDPLRGFSTFAFVPGTQDKHMMAIRSVEEDCVGFAESCKQRSYFLIFDTLTGKVLSEEIKFPEDLKFEGLEFVDVTSKPPPAQEV